MPDGLPTPDDYSLVDGFDSDAGVEQCPHCDATLDHDETVYDQTGGKHDALYDPPARAGPFFCTACWPELDANSKTLANRTLFADYRAEAADD